jgi:hypothetical protein
MKTSNLLILDNQMAKSLVPDDAVVGGVARIVYSSNPSFVGYFPDGTSKPKTIFGGAFMGELGVSSGDWEMVEGSLIFLPINYFRRGSRKFGRGNSQEAHGRLDQVVVTIGDEDYWEKIE